MLTKREKETFLKRNFSQNINRMTASGTSSGIDLKSRAIIFMDLISNKRNFEKASEYVHPDIVQKKREKTVQGKGEMLNTFKTMIEVHAPNFHVEFLDALEEGLKVWAYVRISGLPGGIVKDSIDLTEWSEDGRLVRAQHVQQVL